MTQPRSTIHSEATDDICRRNDFKFLTLFETYQSLFAIKEFFRFFADKLGHFFLIFLFNKHSSLTAKIGKRRKTKFGRIHSRTKKCQNRSYEWDTWCQFHQAAFTLVDRKSVKKIDNLTVIFMHLGSACVKAAPKTLMKLIPTVVNPNRACGKVVSLGDNTNGPHGCS